MEPGPHRSLTRLAAALAAAVALLLVAGWLAPDVARRLVQTRRGGTAALVADRAAVDAFVAEALQRAGATQQLQRQESEDVVTATWQLAPAVDASTAAASLQADARAAGVELHAATRDLLDAEVRVYAGSHLRQDLLLVPTLPAAAPLPPAPNRRERPLVSIIVGGLGRQQARGIVQTDAPLSVAIQPWQPYSLALARDAAAAWQEVLLDLDDSVEDIAAAKAALPYASGLLAREGVELRAAEAVDDNDVLVTLQPLPVASPTSPRALIPWRARQRRAGNLRARIRWLVERDGICAVFVEPDDPALPDLLRWASAGHDNGYRLVHASELLRAGEMVGMLDADNPRAHAD